jgi:hypothetical protein
MFGFCLRADLKCYAVLLSILSIASISSVNAWHENFGISDENATKMYNDPNIDPDISNNMSYWKAGLQWELDFINMACIDIPTGPDRDGEVCHQKVKTVSDNCLHHPKIDEECSDPKIQIYMTKHNISGTYDSTYTRIQPVDPETSTLKDSMQEISKNLICKILPDDC